MRAILLGLCGWVVAAGATDLKIRVRLQDYASVPAVWLTKAKAVATGILDKAGVELYWADCSLNLERRDMQCRVPPDPMDLQLRILTPQMAKHVQRSPDVMGIAMVSGRFPSIASVFYHRAVELEGGKVGARGEILGGILAHEIGHLLLAETSHSRSGVLRAEWSDEDLRTIACGRLWFTPQQARRMALLVTERVHAAQSVAEFPQPLPIQTAEE